MHGFGVTGERTWATPEATGVGRMAMRSPLVPFADADSARRGHVDGSSWFRSLNGRWWFVLVDRPEDVPADFAAPDLDPSGGDWRPIAVPGSWSMQGWGSPRFDIPGTERARRPDDVPAPNPTGLYRTAFSIPADWVGRRVIVHIGGAESVVYVYVNGEPVGMSKDSHLSCEFDISHLVRPGANTLACMVVQLSDTTHLEGHGSWNLGGIHREVYCYAAPPNWISDLKIVAGVDRKDATTGLLELTASVGFEDDVAVEAGWRVEAVLETLEGEAVEGGSLVGELSEDLAPFLFGDATVVVSGRIAGVAPWSAEQPHLYRLVVSLVDPHDVVREVVTERVGFRSVEIRSGELTINGAAVKIHGVVHRPFDPVTGHAVDPKALRDDLAAMKRANFNAVRCPGSPPPLHMLEACDELGLYVFDEADLETGITDEHLCSDQRYLSAFVERAARMVQRDKNHPSVIAWSLGSGVGQGPNYDAMAAWVRGYDPTRPVAYGGSLDGEVSPDSGVSDIGYPRFVDAASFEAMALDAIRPVVMSAYSYSMGNSDGALDRYFEVADEHKAAAGDFVWCWKDFALADDSPDPTWAGLTAADGTERPAVSEHRYLAAPVTVTASENDLRRRRVRITNRQCFVGVSWLVARWQVAVDGVVCDEGEMDLPDVAPRATAVVDLAFERPAIAEGETVTLTIRFTTATPVPWADRGHEVAWQQFTVPLARKSIGEPRKPDTSQRFTVERDRAEGSVRGAVGTSSVKVNEGTGAIIRIRLFGRDALVSPPRLSLWRAPTDNDRTPGVGPAERWFEMGLDALHRSPVGSNVEVDHEGGFTAYSRHKLWGTDPGQVITHRQRMTMTTSGDLLFSEEVDIPEAFEDLPRLGVFFVVPEGFERLIWLGPGPGEAYPDRRAGSVWSRWKTYVREQSMPYVRAQEHGLRTGVSWFALEHDGEGFVSATRRRTGLLVAALDGGTLSFSASHYSAEDLSTAHETGMLERRDDIQVHVDVAHRGLGTLRRGADTPERFRIGGGVHRWSWRLRAYDPALEDPGELATQVLPHQ